MFEQYRKFKTCIHCGLRRKLTREHIFGAGLADIHPVLHNWESEADSLPFGRRKKGGSPILRITSKFLCFKCNNEGSSKRVDDFLPVGKRLIAGSTPELSPMDVLATTSYLNQLAVAVDIMTSNFEATDKYRASEDYRLNREYRQDPPLIDSSSRLKWATEGKGIPVRSWIGYHKGVLGLDPIVNARFWRPPDVNGKPKVVGKAFSFVIGHWAVFLEIGSQQKPPPETYLLIDATQNKPASISKEVSYEDFFRTFAPSPKILGVIESFKDPERVTQIEHESKRKGRFTL